MFYGCNPKIDLCLKKITVFFNAKSFLAKTIELTSKRWFFLWVCLIQQKMIQNKLFDEVFPTSKPKKLYGRNWQYNFNYAVNLTDILVEGSGSLTLLQHTKWRSNISYGAVTQSGSWQLLKGDFFPWHAIIYIRF